MWSRSETFTSKKQQLKHMLQIVDIELNMLEYWIPLKTYGCSLGLFHRISVIHSISTCLEQGKASRGRRCEPCLPTVPGCASPVAFIFSQHCIKVQAAVLTEVTKCWELPHHIVCWVWFMQWLPCPFAFLYFRSCRATKCQWTSRRHLDVLRQLYKVYWHWNIIKYINVNWSKTFLICCMILPCQ